MDYGYKNAILQTDYQCFVYEDAPPEVNLHEHDYDELLLFISGDVTYSIAGRPYILLPGDLVAVPSRTLHQPFFGTCRSYNRVVLWIKRKYLQSFSTPGTDLTACFAAGGRVVHLTETEREHFETLARKAGANGPGYGADLEAHCAFLNLLLLANRAMLEHRTRSADTGTEPLQNAVVEMERNYTASLDLERLATLCYVSKYHFARQFKRIYGITAHQYLTKVRLAKAKLLLPKGMPVAEVAYKCGFGNYNTFLKAFKKVYGVTPGQYVRLVEQKNL